MNIETRNILLTLGMSIGIPALSTFVVVLLFVLGLEMPPLMMLFAVGLLSSWSTQKALKLVESKFGLK